MNDNLMGIKKLNLCSEILNRYVVSSKFFFEITKFQMIAVKKLLLLVIFAGACSTMVQAQNLIDEPDSVVLTPDIQRILDAPEPTKFGTDYQGFIEKWQANGFSATQKEQLTKTLVNLEKMGMRPRFDFKDIFFSFYQATEKRKFSAERMDELAEAALKVTRNHPEKIVRQYFSSLRIFIEDMALRKDRTFGLYVENGDFEIEYNGGDEDTGDGDVIVLSQPEASLDDVYDPDQPQPQVEQEEPELELMEEYGPVIELKDADLVFRSRLDTVRIKATKAYFNFETRQIIGLGGVVDWSNVGLPSEMVNTKLEYYEFNADQDVITFEGTLFQYVGKIPEPIYGNLTIHSNPPRRTEDSYPRFVSESANSAMEGLEGSGLEYRGGITYHGRQFYSRSAYDYKSVLKGSWEGERKFRAEATTFNFNRADSSVRSGQAAVTIYHGEDSVYHPVVEFDYNYGLGYLTLVPGKNGFQTTPFRTSFYNMDVVGDILSWDLKSDSFNIATNSARTEVPVLIESKNYYNANRFYSLSELYNFHPLLMAIKQADDYGGNSFYLADLVDNSGIGKGVLKRTMIGLMAKGLVKFDEITEQVTITEKGYHYRDANQGDSDYDDLIIPSITGEAPNMTVNTLNNEATVRGVEKFYVSDSLDVIITPTNGEIKVLQNRDIEFDGSLEAGNFRFMGQRFTFQYDSFKVKLTEIDSIALQVEIEEGKRENLNNQLVKTSGELLINEPDNKSSLKSNPQYPIFNSGTSASAYFNKTGVLNNAYDSTVYFDVPPFKLDSAADADPSTFAFEGTFHSNGIFPEFKEDLVAMPDKSFGFVHSIPDSGYSLYKTSGKLFGEVRMDQNGLTSPGEVEYLTGSFKAESVTFFLDSMYSEKGIEGTIAPGDLNGTSFPPVTLKRYEINWLAKKDSMNLRNLEDPFQIYDSLGKFNGMLSLSPTGLLGAGDMEIQGSTTESEAFTLEENQFQARNSLFELKSNNPRKPILQSDDVKITYNVQAQNATISPEVQGNASIEFPFAQYKTSIPEAEWDISNKMITMTKPDTVPIEKSFFYATRPSMDSLVFSATNATYDIEKQEMKVEGIPHIVVADALITPENNEVLILENAEIGELTNAVVVFDTAATNHRLYDATINIRSRGRFTGEGTYELVTVQDTFAIKFDQFRLEEDEEGRKYTMSSGNVRAEEGVKVSPGFTFKGQVLMRAYRKALELKGAVKLDLKKLKERNVWIEYASNDSISEVIFNFDEAQTEFGDPLNAGLHFNGGDIYLSFITEKRGPDDDDFFIPSGGSLFYDQEKGSYNIANRQKQEDPTTYYAGNMFSYNEETQDVSFEGKLNFVSPYNKGIEFQASGKGEGNLDSVDFKVNAMLAMNIGLPVNAVPLMAENLKIMGEKLGVRRAHQDRSDLIYKVAEFIGDESTKAWDNSYQTVPQPLVNVSPLLVKDLVITNVDLKWSKQNRAFYSEGKIGVSNVNTTDLNMELDGFVEIRKTPDGDIVNILLQMTDGTWYYFTHDGGSLGVYSSNKAFNDIILGAGGGKKKVGSFNVYANTIEEVIAWSQGFRKFYYGIDEPYRLVMSDESNQSLKKKDKVEGDGF